MSIKSIKGIKEAQRQAHPDIVAELESMLADAKAGKITAIVTMYQVDGEALSQCVAGKFANQDYIRFIGLSETVKFQLVSKLFSGADIE